jgi:uncharacterized membrane protein YkvA (DUF1232 family)
MTTTINADVTLPAVIERNERVVRAGFWRKLRRLIGKLPFVEDLVAAYYCAMDPSTPLTARAVLLGAVAYFVLPIDAIPDAFAIFGFTDDAGVLATAIAVAGSNIRDAHRQAAKRMLLSDRA